MQKHVGAKHGILEPKEKKKLADNPQDFELCIYCDHPFFGKDRDRRRKTRNKHLLIHHPEESKA